MHCYIWLMPCWVPRATFEIQCVLNIYNLVLPWVNRILQKIGEEMMRKEPNLPWFEMKIRKKEQLLTAPSYLMKFYYIF